MISVLLRFFIIPGSFNQEITNRIKVVEAKNPYNKIHAIPSTSKKNLEGKYLCQWYMER